MSNTPFQAFRIHNDSQGYRAEIEHITFDELSAGDVLIRVQYSSVNYKDALAGTGKGKILRQFPLNGGIDCAGTVVHCNTPQFKLGDAVLVTGSGLSETLDGGYSEYVRIAHQHVISIPDGFSCRDAMILGTAGFTAGLALLRMLENRQKPEMGAIAINGATGGVGMLAMLLFAKAGFEVHAISGKPQYTDLLKSIGAAQVLTRDEILSDKSMDSIRFGGAVDSVGGEMLASLLAQTTSYGNVASCGLVSSTELHSTVMPFIIRGVSLLGIASAGTERNIRENVWHLLAKHLNSNTLNTLPVREISLNGLPEIFEQMLSGQSFGRSIVKIASEAC
jgi:acrylyl-CoA reductase (NADPH)